MNWHHTPKDGAWREAHLAMLVKLGMGLHLRCDACHHCVTEDPRLFAARNNLDLLTPMLTVSKALRCMHCGARKERVARRRGRGPMPGRLELTYYKRRGHHSGASLTNRRPGRFK